MTKNLDDRAVDEAARYLATTRGSQHSPLTPDKEKKLRRKIDSWMIPLVRACREAEQHVRDQTSDLARTSSYSLPLSER